MKVFVTGVKGQLGYDDCIGCALAGQLEEFHQRDAFSVLAMAGAGKI